MVIVNSNKDQLTFWPLLIHQEHLFLFSKELQLLFAGMQTALK